MRLLQIPTGKPDPLLQDSSSPPAFCDGPQYAALFAQGFSYSGFGRGFNTLNFMRGMARTDLGWLWAYGRRPPQPGNVASGCGYAGPVGMRDLQNFCEPLVQACSAQRPSRSW